MVKLALASWFGSSEGEGHFIDGQYRVRRERANTDARVTMSAV